MPQAHNNHVDALATLTSKVDLLAEALDVQIMMKTLRATIIDSIPASMIEDQEWHSYNVKNLNKTIFI